jgi:Na+/H+ antiporter NhaA
MSKLTGTIAFVGGVFLILMAITGILIKNERQVASSHQVVTEVVVEAETEHGGGHEVPQWLSIAMYATLIVSGAFTIIQISRFGLSTEPSAMSTAAFVGGMVLVGFGFLATLAVSEKNFRDRDKLEAAELAMAEPLKDHDAEGHGSAIPDNLRFWMMSTLFIAGGVTVVHVSKYGLA